MFIEVTIQGKPVSRVKVKAFHQDLTMGKEKAIEVRQNLVDLYVHELKQKYPEATFHLSVESRVWAINNEK